MGVLADGIHSDKKGTCWAKGMLPSPALAESQTSLGSICRMGISARVLARPCLT